MARVAGRKTRHFEVVVHQAPRLRQRVVLTREELLLIVVARSPGEHRSEIEGLAFNLPEHVLRQHAFGWILVMGAAGRVNVMVA